jgi:hypothetical protein
LPTLHELHLPRGWLPPVRLHSSEVSRRRTATTAQLRASPTVSFFIFLSASGPPEPWPEGDLFKRAIQSSVGPVGRHLLHIRLDSSKRCANALKRYGLTRNPSQRVGGPALAATPRLWAEPDPPARLPAGDRPDAVRVVRQMPPAPNAENQSPMLQPERPAKKAALHPAARD